MTYNDLCKTTREIIGKTTVPAAKLRNIDSKRGTAQVHIEDRIYDAVLGTKSFHLTGDYVTK